MCSRQLSRLPAPKITCKLKLFPKGSSKTVSYGTYSKNQCDYQCQNSWLCKEQVLVLYVVVLTKDFIQDIILYIGICTVDTWMNIHSTVLIKFCGVIWWYFLYSCWCPEYWEKSMEAPLPVIIEPEGHLHMHYQCFLRMSVVGRHVLTWGLLQFLGRVTLLSPCPSQSLLSSFIYVLLTSIATPTWVAFSFFSTLSFSLQFCC